jgi:hypothetical protein
MLHHFDCCSSAQKHLYRHWGPLGHWGCTLFLSLAHNILRSSCIAKSWTKPKDGLGGNSRLCALYCTQQKGWAETALRQLITTRPFNTAAVALMGSTAGI